MKITKETTKEEFSQELEKEIKQHEEKLQLLRNQEEKGRLLVALKYEGDFFTGSNKIHYLDPKDLDSAKRVLEYFIPEQVTWKDSQSEYTGAYHCRTSSGIRENKFIIEWKSGGEPFRMTIQIGHEPIEDHPLFSEFIRRGVDRSPTDSETVYFGGVSRTEMMRHRVKVYDFIGVKQVGWYGGDRSTASNCDEVINRFINA